MVCGLEARDLVRVSRTRLATEISRIVDFGCGDWQSSKLIDWGGATYLGIDVVSDLIDRNEKCFTTEKVSFKNSDSLLGEKGDLLIVKDVLQHLPILMS